MKPSLLTVLFFSLCSGLFFRVYARDFYQLTVYEYTSDEQEKQLDSYLENAYLPALHRAGIADVGVFKPFPKQEEKILRSIYVFIPFKNRKSFFNLEHRLSKDKEYQETGAAYINAAYDSPPFDRKEVILMDAFTGHGHYRLPALKSSMQDRVYELRSYESATEKLYRNKVRMFNKGDEIGLFRKLGFNAVFYAEVVSGSQMPNLMYLTTFENMQSREEHWKTFGDDPYWKSLSGKAEYRNNVSRAEIMLLYPVAYSDI
ncbi:NIPSNAP family protein [Sinomicrobium oceani]|uniref:NIPSNAP family protein n=1 Tax=Sinomicrobium oceani TaxID=1150368 RepID=UPI00227D6A2E|nr:NIPSNAP family protein [Sinomicrobium oceani]